jgi:hypothetical protein
MMNRTILLAALLFGCASAPVTQQKPEIVTEPAHTAPSVVMDPACPKPGEFQAVDLSEPATAKFLDAMHALGLKTIIRYYDYPQETIAGKTPKVQELGLILSRGFDLMMVFQHNNNRLSSFTQQRGKDDSARALQLAASWGQPKGSGIYFGVDGDWPDAQGLLAVKTYFEAAGKAVRLAGYKVGAYGSGKTCAALGGAVDFCWLANARGWSGYQEALQKGGWALKQSPPIDCAGINVDFDQAHGEFGAWKP